MSKGVSWVSAADTDRSPPSSWSSIDIGRCFLRPEDCNEVKPFIRYQSIYQLKWYHTLLDEGNRIVHANYVHTAPAGDLGPGGCFTKVSRALQNNLAKIHNARNPIYGENFKLKLCTCTQSIALGSRTKFQLEILIKHTISVIHKFWENILESSRNLSETTPWCQLSWYWLTYR